MYESHIDFELKKYFPNYKYPKESRFTKLFNELSSISSNQIQDYVHFKISKEIKATDNPDEKRSYLQIILSKIKANIDKRSSIIIKGFPSKMKPLEVYNLIKTFYNDINFFYIPSYIQNQKEYMYAFINVNNYKGIIHIYKSFMSIKEKFRIYKGYDLSNIEMFYSKTQGKNALVKQYINEAKNLNPDSLIIIDS